MLSYPDLGDSIPWLNVFPVVFVEDVILVGYRQSLVPVLGRQRVRPLAEQPSFPREEYTWIP